MGLINAWSNTFNGMGPPFNKFKGNVHDIYIHENNRCEKRNFLQEHYLLTPTKNLVLYLEKHFKIIHGDLSLTEDTLNNWII